MPDNPSHHRPSAPPPHTASDAIPHVPKTLLDELHQANEEFAESRLEREAAIDGASYSSTPRDEAREHVREAEKKVEAVTEKIDTILNASSPPSNPPSSPPSDPPADSD